MPREFLFAAQATRRGSAVQARSVGPRKFFPGKVVRAIRDLPRPDLGPIPENPRKAGRMPLRGRVGRVNMDGPGKVVFAICVVLLKSQWLRKQARTA